jgi:hypothetical protein
MKGIHINIWAYPTLELFNQIKAWGFDTVQFEVWWGNISKEDGTFRPDWTPFLQNYIDMAHAAGLKVIFTMRVCYDPNNPMEYYTDWSLGPTHDYVNMTQEGRTRYCAFLEKIATTFPQVDYFCPWHFPYHRQDFSDAQKQTYVNITFPAMYAALRKHTGKPVIFNPPHHGSTNIIVQADNGFYLNFAPYSFPVIYAVNSCIKWQVLTGSEAWDGNTSTIDGYFEGIRVFRQKYSAEMACLEFAGWYNVPLDENRMSCFKEVLARMSRYNVGFIFWRYEGANYPTQDIIDAMRDVSVEPPPQAAGAIPFLLVIGGLTFAGLLIGLTSGRKRIRRRRR